MTRTIASLRIVVLPADSDGVVDDLAVAADFAVESVAPEAVHDRLTDVDCAVVIDPTARTDVLADGVPAVLYTETEPDAVGRSDRFDGYARKGDAAALADQVRWVARASNRRGYVSRIRRLHDGTTALTGVRTTDELFESATDTAADVLEFDMCYVAVRDGETLVPRAVSDDAPSSEARPMHVSEGLLGKTYRTGESFLVDDVNEHEDAEPASAEFGAGISVPIGDVGVFQAVSHRTGAFDATDLELAELLASHIAVVHERIEAEVNMRTERDRLSALFENIPDAAVSFEFVDGEPIVRGVNSAFEGVFGYPTADVIGRNLDDHVVPDDPESERGATRLNELLKRGESVKRECRRVTRNGHREFLLHVIPLRLGEANVAGYAIYTDITERDRREQLLSNLHETSRQLMRADTREEVYDVALDAVEHVFGYPVNAIHVHDEERDALELVAATDAEEGAVRSRPTYVEGSSVVWEVFESQEPRVFESVDDVGDSYDRPGVESVMFLPVGEYGVLSFGSPRADEFTESTAQVGQILAANVETALGRAERTHLLRERERELRRQNERLEEFASIVSHDLRNPLAVARGYLDIAQADDDADAFERVRGSLDRMDRLIENVLSLARKGQVVGETTELDVVGLAREAWVGVETRAGTLETAGECPVDGDENRLRDLFANLFRNSVEHAGPDVTVRVGSLDGGDGFYVEDDGPGIPASERQRAFEPGHSTGENGIGFGLPIVRRIVEAHGWTLDLTDGDDGGARFEIRVRRDGDEGTD